MNILITTGRVNLLSWIRRYSKQLAVCLLTMPLRRQWSNRELQKTLVTQQITATKSPLSLMKLLGVYMSVSCLCASRCHANTGCSHSTCLNSLYPCLFSILTGFQMALRSYSLRGCRRRLVLQKLIQMVLLLILLKKNRFRRCLKKCLVSQESYQKMPGRTSVN